MTLTAGQYYEIDYKKGRAVFLYQGTDLGGNHFFVAAKACYRVAAKRIDYINAKPAPQKKKKK